MCHPNREVSMRARLLAGAALLFAAASASAYSIHQRSVGEDQEALAAQASISTDSATAIALAGFPGASVEESELEVENGILLYCVDLEGPNGASREDHIDAKTGAIVPVDDDDDDEDDDDDDDEDDDDREASGRRR